MPTAAPVQRPAPLCACRPFESGEVTVQPYNTLLSMSSLVELSSGILLLQNEVLAATCSRLLGVKHPTFKVSTGAKPGGQRLRVNSFAARACAGAVGSLRKRAQTGQPQGQEWAHGQHSAKLTDTP